MLVIDIHSLTRDECSVLMYAETCLVDGGGLLAAQRMNEDDHANLNKFKEAGILDWGRIPFHAIERLRLRHPHGGLSLMYWVKFNDAAWTLAHQLRRQRAENTTSSNRKIVDEALAAKAGL